MLHSFIHSYKRFLKVHIQQFWEKKTRLTLNYAEKFAIGQKYFVFLHNSLHTAVYMYLAKEVNKNVWYLAL